MSLDSYVKSLQEIQSQVTFLNQQNAKDISLAALGKIIKKLDSFNKKPLPLSEFHSVKALYEETNILACRLQSNPPSAQHVPLIKDLLSKVCDIVHLSSTDQMNKITSSNIKTLACLSVLKDLSVKEKDTAKKIAKQIPSSTVKKKVLQALKQDSSLNIQNLIFVAKKDTKIEESFLRFHRKKETSLQARFWKPITGYFNPTTSLTGYCTEKLFKKIKKTRLKKGVFTQEFVPLPYYALQKKSPHFSRTYQENKEAILKKFLQDHQASLTLLPLLCKYGHLQKLPSSLANIEKVFLEYQKDPKACETKIKALLL